MSPASGPMKVGYYLRVQGVVRGPFNLEQLQRMRAQGQLQRFHEISSDRRQWISAGSVLELFAPGSGIPTPNGGITDLPVEPVVPIEDLPGPRRPRSWPRWLNAKVLLGVGGGLVGVMVLWLVFKTLGGGSAAHGEATTEAVLKILKDHCQKCHGEGSKNGNFNVTQPDSFFASKAAKPAGKYYVERKKPEESAIFLRIQTDMPDGGPPLSARDQDLVRQWILDGAGVSGKEVYPREPITLKDALRLAHDDLVLQPRELRSQIRYFTLHNLHNDNRVSPADLNYYRAALSKLINSLSFHGTVQPVVAVEPKTLVVFRVNLNHYDWPASKWNLLEQNYPYGLNLELDPDANTERMARFLREETRTPQAILRADWFIASASDNAQEVANPNVTGLYHALLGIPDNVADLERKVRVDTLANIKRFAVQRAGFAVSGVSRQNRLLERHQGELGYYWVSYDFAPGNPFSNLRIFPFGPKGKDLVFNGNSLDEHSFVADGGEIIFSLPNKLQGYMLINKIGKRIPNGPPEVVFDEDAKDQIVNGISCFGCHQTGIRRKLDEIRNNPTVPFDKRGILNSLYPGAAEVNKLFDRDEKDYLEALGLSYQGVVTRAELAKEPIKYSHGNYLKTVDLTKAALELDLFFDLDDPATKINPVETLRKRIENNPKLKSLGLGSLILPDPIPIHRAFWEQNFPQIVETLDIGRPLRPSGKSRP